ncbi:MAG: 16S rRNA (cytosine(967)-C(5))-methyltransferase RsmB [Ignavibacteria bacterium]|nr:16S rRNA (cytosine(967)-C(5))-methyltransferase RsmB [Ignavibacteria bacterium]
MTENLDNSGENVKEELKETIQAPVFQAPVLNENKTAAETEILTADSPQAPEVKNNEPAVPIEKPKSDGPPAGKTYSKDKRYPNKRDKPRGDTIYSDARSISVKILTRVERTDSYLDKLIDYEIRTEILNDYDKSLLNEICHGVIRWMRRLDWFLNGFYRGNWEKCTPEIKNTLRVALYQILFLNKIPDFAAVNEAVEFVKKISTQKHADVVNGLLRTIIRTKNDLVYPTREIDEVKYLAIMQSHPNWMIKRWIERFGFDDAAILAEANNKRPILTLRINTLKTGRNEVFKRFEERNIVFRTCRYIDYFVTLRLMSKIYLDEDFVSGKYTVQDESAGLPAVLLNPKENDVILDMCAAPGGKSTHIAQLIGNKGKIYSVDKYDAKINMMRKNAERLGITNIEFIQDDATDFQNPMLKDIKFDKILLDAPCSGLGVLSKKPEIRWKREMEDILALAILQKKLLNSAANYLKPGGVIVYSTCSTEPEENMDIVKDFIEKNPDFYIDSAAQYVNKDLVNADGCIETFQHKHNIDGSFAARLIRRAQ